MILGLHHVQITIPRGSEEEARRFYCELLGLKELIKPPVLKDRGGFWLAVGDREVHIGTEDQVDRFVTKAHVAYQVKDLNQWRKKLSEKNVQLTASIPIPHYERFEFRDPFGNRIELIERKQ